MSLRNTYPNNGKVKGLLNYSDSVYHYLAGKYDNEIVRDIKTAKSSLNEKDTITITELLYHSLKGEQLIQSDLAKKLPIFCGFTTTFETFLNKEKYKIGDTVYITVDIFELDKETLDIRNFKIINEDTGNDITCTKTDIGLGILYSFIANEPGKYKVSGKYIFHYGDYGDSYFIRDSFMIE